MTPTPTQALVARVRDGIRDAEREAGENDAGDWAPRDYDGLSYEAVRHGIDDAITVENIGLGTLRIADLRRLCDAVDALCALVDAREGDAARLDYLESFNYVEASNAGIGGVRWNVSTPHYTMTLRERIDAARTGGSDVR